MGRLLADSLKKNVYNYAVGVQEEKGLEAE